MAHLSLGVSSRRSGRLRSSAAKLVMVLLVSSVPPVLAAAPAQAQPTGTLNGSMEFQCHGTQDNYPGPGAGSCSNFSLVIGETYFHEVALSGVDAEGYAYALWSATPFAGTVSVSFNGAPSCFLTPFGGSATGTMVSTMGAVRATSTQPVLTHATLTMNVTWDWTAAALQVVTQTVTVSFGNGGSFTASPGAGRGALTFMYATDEWNMPQPPIGCDPHDNGRFVSHQVLEFGSGPQVPRAFSEGMPLDQPIGGQEEARDVGETCIRHEQVCVVQVHGTNDDESFTVMAGWEDGAIAGSTPPVCVNDPDGDCEGTVSADPSPPPSATPPSPYYEVGSVCVHVRVEDMEEGDCTPEQSG